MGFITHHCVVVTAWNDADAEKAHHEAEVLFTDLAHVTPLSPPAINSYVTFVVCPDGSKEGWGDSLHGDAAREQFKEWLRAQCYSDGSSPFEWAEISYGSDPDCARVEDSAWPKRE